MRLNEVIKEAEYADIILSLLDEPYRITSVTKIIFFAFCIKHEDNYSSYNNRTKDFVDVFFSNLSLKMASNYTDISKILYILKMLVNSEKLTISGDTIKIIENINHTTENKFINICNKKVPNPIIEINKLDATAVIEEVIRFV